jgi:hypothetical protein
MARQSTIRETLSDHLALFVKLYVNLSRGRGCTKLNISRDLSRLRAIPEKSRSPVGTLSRFRQGLS